MEKLSGNSGRWIQATGEMLRIDLVKYLKSDFVERQQDGAFELLLHGELQHGTVAGMVCLSFVGDIAGAMVVQAVTPGLLRGGAGRIIELHDGRPVQTGRDAVPMHQGMQLADRQVEHDKKCQEDFAQLSHH